MKYTRIFLIIAAIAACATRVSAQGADSYIINHFVNDPSVVEAHLVVTDVEGKGPIVRMKFYDNDGVLVGEGKELLDPYGKLNQTPGKYVDRVANGTIHITSEGGNIVAEYWQFYKDPAESWKNTTTIGQEAVGYKKLVCPHFVSDPDVEVYIVLANTDTRDVMATVTFHDDQGQEIGKIRQLIKTNGKAAVLPWNVVKKKATGVAFITTDGGRITADYWQAENAKHYQIATPVAGM